VFLLSELFSIILPDKLLTPLAGTLASLKNVKKDVLEMKKGSECGMGFDSWTDFEIGDLVQSYDEKQEKRYL
jgi:translation initiation factor IF-2